MRIRIFILLVALLSGTGSSSRGQDAGADMEALMRQFQYRWVAIHRTPIAWPTTPAGNVAPAYPDGFYGASIYQAHPQYVGGSIFSEALETMWEALFVANDNLSLHYIVGGTLEGLTPNEAAARVLHYAKAPKLDEIDPLDQVKRLALVQGRIADMTHLLAPADHNWRTRKARYNEIVSNAEYPSLAEAVAFFSNKFDDDAVTPPQSAHAIFFPDAGNLALEAVEFKLGFGHSFTIEQASYEFEPVLATPIISGTPSLFACFETESGPGAEQADIDRVMGRASVYPDGRYHQNPGSTVWMSPPTLQGRVGSAIGAWVRVRPASAAFGGNYTEILFEDPTVPGANQVAKQLFLIPIESVAPRAVYVRPEPDSDSIAANLRPTKCPTAGSKVYGIGWMGSANYAISLGLDQIAGQPSSLKLQVGKPSPQALSPEALGLSGNADSEAVSDISGTLRQFVGGASIAHVSLLDPATPGKGYRLSIQKRDRAAAKGADGTYPINGSQRSTYTFSNDDASGLTFDAFTITEVNGGRTKVTRFAYAQSDDSWTRTYADGRRIERLIKMPHPTDPSLRSETITLEDSNGGILSRTRSTYKAYPFGERMVSHTIDPTLLDDDQNVVHLGRGLTATWDYYTPTDSPHKAGLRKQIVTANGAWTRYEYDDTRERTKMIEGYLDSPPGSPDDACRVTTYSRVPGPGGTTTTTIVELLGTEIARSYRLENLFGDWELQETTVQGAGWDDPSNLRTAYEIDKVGPVAGRAGRISHPDGTATHYHYAIDGPDIPGSNTLTTTVSSGKAAPDGSGIVDGIRTTTVTGRQEIALSTTTSDIATGLELSRSDALTIDSFGRPTTIRHSNSNGSAFAHTTTNYDCCGIASTTDRAGIYTGYDNSDELVSSSTSLGIKVTSAVAAEARPGGGRIETTIRVAVDDNGNAIAGTATLISRREYDAAGYLVVEYAPPANADADPDPADLAARRATSFSETFDAATGHRRRTTTNPDGTTIVTENSTDGHLLKIAGTGTHHRRYEYGVEVPPGSSGPAMRFTRTILQNPDGSDSSEWEQSYIDRNGRAVRSRGSSGATTLNSYNENGQLASNTDPDGVTTLYAYDGRGRLEITAVDLNRDGDINFDGTDPITKTTTGPAERNGRTVLRTLTLAWAGDGDENSVSELSRVETSTDGRDTWSSSDGLETHTVTSYAGSGNITSQTSYPDGTSQESITLAGRLRSVTRWDNAGTPVTEAFYDYDELGRTEAVSDARNGTTSITYYTDDSTSSTTTPDPDGAGGPQLPQTTSLSYDLAGRRSLVSLPDSSAADPKTVTYQYYPTGELKSSSGSRIYSIGYTYDYAGRPKTLSSGSGTTTWHYFPDSGLLQSKRDADGRGPSFTYTPAGRLLTRTLARGSQRRTSYGDDGLPRAVDYFSGGDGSAIDPSTPPISYTYDRLGNLATLGDAAGLHIFTTTPTGRTELETIAGGLLGGSSIDPVYDLNLRRKSLLFNGLGSAQLAHHHRYDAAGRYRGAAAGANPALAPQVTYSYHPNSNLLDTAQSTVGTGAVRLSLTRQYDHLNRLTSLSVAAANLFAPLDQSFTFDHNVAGQRERIALADGRFWQYTYDARGQLNSATRHLPDGSPIASQTHTFNHDQTGNRTASGDGLQASAKTYAPNGLNQYTEVTDDGTAWISGQANPAATITVDGATANRPGAGSYFERQITTDNSGGPAFAKHIVRSILGEDEDRVTRFTRTPAASTTPQYDADGNLTRDSFYQYTWDGEDRLSTLQSRVDNLPANFHHHRLEFAYDSLGRRIEKKVYGLVDGSWELARHKRFLYDGWNLLAEYEPGSNGSWHATASYLWGKDLSGSLGGAGGTGGLVHLRDHIGDKGYFVAYDGRGNVSALIDDRTRETAAQYSYSPFGHLAEASGPAAHLNPFRFSTRYQDTETGLYYYGYRYYDPEHGRWLNRDPLGEAGGGNLYGFVGNDPVNSWDYLGLLDIWGYFRGEQGWIPGYSTRSALQAGVNEAASLSRAGIRGALQGSGNVVAAGVDVVQGIYGTGKFVGTEIATAALDRDQFVAQWGERYNGFVDSGAIVYDLSRDSAYRKQLADQLRPGVEAYLSDYGNWSKLLAEAGVGFGTIGIGTAGWTRLLDRLKQLNLGKLLGAVGKSKKTCDIPIERANLVDEISLPREAQRALLREALQSLGTGKIAHHLVPLEGLSKYSSLMERAAKGGFDINGRGNGALLDAVEHIGGHPQYNRVVLEELGRINRQARGLDDPDIAGLLQDTADTLRAAINNRTFLPDF